jgi:WD40 repeat protein
MKAHLIWKSSFLLSLLIIAVSIACTKLTIAIDSTPLATTQITTLGPGTRTDKGFVGPTGVHSTPTSTMPEVVTSGNVAKLTKIAELGKGDLVGVAWSPNGEELAVSTRAGIYLYDVLNFKELLFMPVNLVTIAMTFSPDGQKLASGSVIGNVDLWDTKNGKILQTYNTGSMIQSLDICPDNRTLIARDSGFIKLWDIEIGEEILSLDDQDGAYVACSPDGKQFVSSGNVTKLWNIRTGEVIHPTFRTQK